MNLTQSSGENILRAALYKLTTLLFHLLFIFIFTYYFASYFLYYFAISYHVRRSTRSNRN
jgi:hypothetical protein